MRALLRLAAWPVFARRVYRDGRGRDLRPAEAIVVPGARVLPDGSASKALVRRVELGVRLFHEGWAPLLVLVGRGLGPITEAEMMRDQAVLLGVPDERIVLERHSMTTAENARYARQVVRAAHILVATDDTHVRRCVREFARHFSVVDGAGAPTSGRSALRQIGREALIEAWREA